NGMFIVVKNIDDGRCRAAAGGSHPAKDDVLIEGGCGVAAAVGAGGRFRNGDLARRGCRSAAVARGGDRTHALPAPRNRAVRPAATEGDPPWLRRARQPGRALPARIAKATLAAYDAGRPDPRRCAAAAPAAPAAPAGPGAPAGAAAAPEVAARSG